MCVGYCTYNGSKACRLLVGCLYDIGGVYVYLTFMIFASTFPPLHLDLPFLLGIVICLTFWSLRSTFPSGHYDQPCLQGIWIYFAPTAFRSTSSPQHLDATYFHNICSEIYFYSYDSGVDVIDVLVVGLDGVHSQSFDTLLLNMKAQISKRCQCYFHTYALVFSTGTSHAYISCWLSATMPLLQLNLFFAYFRLPLCHKKYCNTAIVFSGGKMINDWKLWLEKYVAWYSLETDYNCHHDTR